MKKGQKDRGPKHGRWSAGEMQGIVLPCVANARCWVDDSVSRPMRKGHAQAPAGVRQRDQREMHR